MKTIQVPIDTPLLEQITGWAQERFKNRSDFIRTACRYFIRHLEEVKKDECYARGYKQIPEEIDMAKVSAEISTHIIEKEDW
ncbi:MAG: ribbon-helix-helix domain-containing protein [bacterium]|nr:ribbon-helix-helix domain-containing protein [bacterium]